MTQGLLDRYYGCLTPEAWGPWVWWPACFSSCLVAAAHFIAWYAIKVTSTSSNPKSQDRFWNPPPSSGSSQGVKFSYQPEEAQCEQQIGTTLETFKGIRGFSEASMSFCTMASYVTLYVQSLLRMSPSAENRLTTFPLVLLCLLGRHFSLLPVFPP